MATTMNFKIGQRVSVSNKKGTIQYIGEPKFAPGKWIGVELDEPQGKNNGSLQGEVYFTCAENHGVFVKQTQVVPLNERSDARPVSTPTPAVAAAAPPATPTHAASTSALPRASPARATTTTAATSGLPKKAVAKSSDPSPLPGDVDDDISSPAATATPPSSAVAPVLAAAVPAPAAAAPQPTPAAAPAPAAVHVPTHAAVSSEARRATRDPLAEERVAALEEQIAKDSVRIQELEKTRMLYEQLVEFKQKWLASQDSLQQQLAAANRALATQKDQLAAEMAVLAETAEMATVDKEIAEEKCKDLEDQMEELKQALDAAKLSKGLAESGGPSGEVVNSPAYKELQAQNGRLKEALVRLKDTADNSAADAAIAAEELAQLKTETDTLRAQYESKMAAVQSLEVALAQARDRLDASASSEALVERLSDKNLALEDRVRKLTEELADMQALVDMNDEIEEARTASEKVIKRDLDQSVTRCLELEAAVEMLDKHNSELRGNLERYRSRLAALEGEASDLRDSQQQQQSAASVEHAQSVKLLTAQLAEKASREREKQITMRLHKLEADQAVQHIALLRTFMPETSFNIDADGLRLLLLLQRLVAKAEMIGAFVCQQFRLDDDMEKVLQEGEMTEGQWAFAHDLNELVNTVLLEARYFITGLEQCSVPVFHTLAAMYPEIARHEASLDALLDRITGDGLDAAMVLDDLRTSCRQLQHITTTHLRTAHPLPPAGHLRDAAAILQTVSDALDGQLHFLRNLFSHCGPDGTLDHSFDGLLQHMTDMAESAKQIKQNARKILRRMPDGKETTVSFDDTVRATITSTVADYRDLHAALRFAGAAIWRHTHDRASLRSLSLDAATQLALESRLDLTDDSKYNAKAIREGADKNMTPIAAFACIAAVRSTVHKLADAVADGDYDAPTAAAGAKNEKPWEVRAQETRKALADNLGLGTQVEKKQQEIKELKTALRIREKECAEQSELLQGLNSRIEGTKAELTRQLAAAEAARADLDKRLQRKEAELAQTTAALEQEIHAAETERDELRKKLEKGGYSRGSSVNTGDASSADVRAARAQVETLSFVISELRAELASLRGKQLVEELEDLPALNLPHTDAATFKILTTTSTVLRDAAVLAAAPAIIDVTPTAKLSPMSQLAAHTSAVAAVDQAARRVAATARDAVQRGSVSAQPPEVCIGKIRLPPGLAAPGPSHVSLTPGQFERLHSVLVS